MTTPVEKATAYLSKLEADRRAAMAASEEKAAEAKLIEARPQGFQEAMEIFGLQLPPTDMETVGGKLLLHPKINPMGKASQLAN